MSRATKQETQGWYWVDVPGKRGGSCVVFADDTNDAEAKGIKEFHPNADAYFVENAAADAYGPYDTEDDAWKAYNQECPSPSKP